MDREVSNVRNTAGLENPKDIKHIMYILLGKCEQNVQTDDLTRIWLIAGMFISLLFMCTCMKMVQLSSM